MGAWIETACVSRRLSESESLPTWGRGLKRIRIGAGSLTTRSLPTWGRGLKPMHKEGRPVDQVVAPYMGAWIETRINPSQIMEAAASLPTWGRGLKPFLKRIPSSGLDVAPYMGAWIETSSVNFRLH